MQRVLDPFQFLLVAVAGWMNQRPLRVIEYLREENRVLREQLGGKRPRLTDDQRRRLATKTPFSIAVSEVYSQSDWYKTSGRALARRCTPKRRPESRHRNLMDLSADS